MKMFCKVCGGRATGIHHGVKSCSGCKIFFLRSIEGKLNYVCANNGQCVVDVKRRSRCKACRFNKCLQVNMERKVRIISRRGAGVRSVGGTGLAQSTPTMARMRVLDLAGNLLSLCVELIRSIPYFQQLPRDMQRRLKKESWKDIFVLTASLIQFNFEDALRMRNIDINESTELKLKNLDRLVNSLRDLRLENTELACMAALVLYRPDLFDAGWIGEDDTQTSQIKLIQENISKLLLDYSRHLSRASILILELLSLAAADKEIISAYFSRSILHGLDLI